MTSNLLKKITYVWILILAVLIVITGCVSNETTEEPDPDGNNIEGSSSSGRLQRSVRIPSNPDIPPSDVLQQISYYAGGGAGMDCDSKCVTSQDGNLVLYNFKSNQRLRILVYKPSGGQSSEYLGVARFITEWEVSVDTNGRLELDLNGGSITSYDYNIYDARDGSWQTRWGAIMNPIIPQGGFYSGSDVKSISGDDRLNIRSGPGISNGVIAKVYHGDQMTIIGSHRVVDDVRWWPVRLRDGTEGWVSELWIAPAD